MPMLEMPMFVYSKNKPIKPGLYWMKTFLNADRENGATSEMVVCIDEHNINTLPSGKEWAGPIPELIPSK